MARVAYQPNSIYNLTSRFRFSENDFTFRRLEIEGRAGFDRWSMSMLYGNYEAQPQIGFLDRRQGILTHLVGQAQRQLGRAGRGTL